MKIINFAIIFGLLISSVLAFSANLQSERIWKLTNRKKSIYLDDGIFHYQSGDSASSLTNVRNSYVASRGYERIVFDFAGKNVPKIYGNVSNPNKKLYIDFANTNLAASLKKLKNTKFVDRMDVFNIDSDTLSVELVLKSKVSFDIFFLDNPGRLVVDIKK